MHIGYKFLHINHPSGICINIFLMFLLLYPKIYGMQPQEELLMEYQQFSHDFISVLQQHDQQNSTNSFAMLDKLCLHIEKQAAQETLQNKKNKLTTICLTIVFVACISCCFYGISIGYYALARIFGTTIINGLLSWLLRLATGLTITTITFLGNSFLFVCTKIFNVLLA